ncbi:hypothetical protein H0H92_001907, partial [Tricholoma furcatifolium]
MYTSGPCFLRASDSEPAGSEISINHWYYQASRERLVAHKTGDLLCYNMTIKAYLPAYWKDFSPYLEDLIRVVWPMGLTEASPNSATHEGFIKVLDEAIKFFELQDDNP